MKKKFKISAGLVLLAVLAVSTASVVHMYENKNSVPQWGQPLEWKKPLLEAAFRQRAWAIYVDHLSWTRRIEAYFGGGGTYTKSQLEYAKDHKKEAVIHKWNRDIVIAKHPVPAINDAILKFIDAVKDVYPYKITVSDDPALTDSDVIINIEVPAPDIWLSKSFGSRFVRGGIYSFGSAPQSPHKVECGREKFCIWDMPISVPSKISYLYPVYYNYKTKYNKRRAFGFYAKDEINFSQHSVPFSPGTGYQVSGALLIDDKNNIEKALCTIPMVYSEHISFDADAIAEFTFECLLRSLGLPSSFNKGFSLLANRTDIVALGYYFPATFNVDKRLSDLDKKMISALYSPEIKSGMRKQDVKSIIKSIK